MLDFDSKEECMRRHLLFIFSLVLIATVGFASGRAASPNLPPDQIIARMEQRFLRQIQDL